MYSKRVPSSRKSHHFPGNYWEFESIKPSRPNHLWKCPCKHSKRCTSLIFSVAISDDWMSKVCCGTQEEGWVKICGELTHGTQVGLSMENSKQRWWYKMVWSHRDKMNRQIYRLTSILYDLKTGKLSRAEIWTAGRVQIIWSRLLPCQGV